MGKSHTPYTSLPAKEDSVELSSVRVDSEGTESKEPINYNDHVTPIKVVKTTSQLKQRLAEEEKKEQAYESRIVHYSDPAAQSCRSNNYTQITRYFFFAGAALEIAAAIIIGINHGEYENNDSLGLAGAGIWALLLASGVALIGKCEKRSNRADGIFNDREERVVPLLTEPTDVSGELKTDDLESGHRIRAESIKSRQEQKMIRKELIYRDALFKIIKKLESSEPENSIHKMPPIVHELILDYLPTPK